MKRKVYTSPLAKRILLTLGLVVLPLSVVSQTQAKNLASKGGKPTIAVVSIADLAGTNINNRAELNARLLYLFAHNPKAVKVLSKGRSSPAGAPLPGFGDCLKNCMQDVGVSPYALIMCAVACALSETGVGAIACAICVGVSVTVIQVCILGCAQNGGKGVGGIMDPGGVGAIKQRHATSGSLQAVLRLKTARGNAS